MSKLLRFHVSSMNHSKNELNQHHQYSSSGKCSNLGESPKKKKKIENFFTVTQKQKCLFYSEIEIFNFFIFH